MAPDIHIQNELKELAPDLAGLPQKVPYSVPVGYFENFAEKLVATLRSDNPDTEIASLSPLLAGLSRKIPYSLPAEYFGDAPAIFQEQDLEFSPLSPLRNMSKKVPYKVPAAYFDQLPHQLLQKITEENKTPARVVNFSRSWLKYAAAAVITGVVAIGGWFYTGSSRGSSDVSASITQQLQAEMQQISDEAIQEYTNQTNSFYYGIASLQNDDLSGMEVHDLLGDVSDEALQQYIQEFNGKTAASIN